MAKAANPIAVPSVKGLKGAVTDYAIGAGGGLIFGLSRQIFGSGFLGSILAAALAGSTVKGTRGETIATLSGFMALSDAFNAPVQAAEDSQQVQVM